MPVTKDTSGPYAPASAILDLIARNRTKGLPAKVDGEVLGKFGVSDSLIPRTLQALQTLDLIDESGKPSQVMEGLRLAPEAEYKQRLGEWLKQTYADALQYVDPATDDETRIRDAFRSYNPFGQQDRMVSLFMGLFRAAGIGPEKAPSPRKAGTATPLKKPRLVSKPAVKDNQGNGGTARQLELPAGLPPAMAGLIASLPAAGAGWTKTKRDQFVQMFGAVLDFTYPIQPEDVFNDVDGDDAD